MIEKKVNVKKILSIVLDVLFVLLFTFGITSIIIRITSNNNDSALSINGNEYRLVLTESMSENNHINNEEYLSYEVKEIPVKSLVTISRIGEDRKSFYDNLKVGDVLSFKYYFSKGQFAGKQVVVTHRLVNKEADPSNSEEYILTLMGDMEKGSGDSQVIKTAEDQKSRNFVIGKVTGYNLALGLIIDFMVNGMGLLFIVVIPCFLLFSYELYRIFVLLINEHYKKKENNTEKTERKQA